MSSSATPVPSRPTKTAIGLSSTHPTLAPPRTFRPLCIHRTPTTKPPLNDSRHRPAQPPTGIHQDDTLPFIP